MIPETKEKIRQSVLLNPTRYWLGKKRPDLTERAEKRRKKTNCPTCDKQFSIRASAKDQKFCSVKCRPLSHMIGNKNGFKKGQSSWNKGKKYPQVTGEKNFNWKGGISSKDKLRRRKFQQTIQKEVFKRDNYTCQICFISGVAISVDHIKSWAKHPELRFEKDNCRTLCMDCHYYITFKRQRPAGNKWGYNLKMVGGGLAI